MASNSADVLDLVDIAVLLNYEKSKASPHIRHTKLVEVCRPGQNPTTAILKREMWNDNSRPRTTVVLARGDGEIDKEVDRILTSEGKPTQDLPQLMRPIAGTTNHLDNIGAKEIETLYHQILAHDGCFMSIALLQHFLDLYPSDTPIRIRHGAQAGNRPSDYIVTIDQRRVLELTLVKPRHTNVILILPDDISHVNGESTYMVHAAMGFYRNEADGMYSAVLDLSSLQFGELGRGPGANGKALFALDTEEEFLDRMSQVAEDHIEESFRVSLRIGESPDDEWLKEVAKKVKERWERRAVEKWCGHCGRALPSPKACALCHEAWYCSVAHQKMSWPFHKHHCSE
ncbi:hypothetical protein GGR57DRAFT_510408 [Xylariaceae sp. FL1272]|nr:hypothetical protein GGR57DRAFT_510408 [Xylariaceae sp. FL1272]